MRSKISQEKIKEIIMSVTSLDIMLPSVTIARDLKGPTQRLIW